MTNISSTKKAIKKLEEKELLSNPINWKKGDIIKLINNHNMGAQIGSTARIRLNENTSKYVLIGWLDTLSEGQMDGDYNKNNFIKIKKTT